MGRFPVPWQELGQLMGPAGYDALKDIFEPGAARSVPLCIADHSHGAHDEHLPEMIKEARNWLAVKGWTVWRFGDDS